MNATISDPFSNYFVERLEKARRTRTQPAFATTFPPQDTTTAKNIPAFYKDLYKKNGMSRSRANHSMQVAELAYSLARTHGLEPDDAWHAGMLHDLYKESSPKRSVKLAKQTGIPLPEWRFPPGTVSDALHPLLAAKRARSLGLSRPFADAIGKHMNGHINMSPHAKLLFVADSCAYGRNATPVINAAREVMHTNLDEAASILARDQVKKLALAVRPGRKTKVNRNVTPAMSQFMSAYQYRDISGNRPTSGRAITHSFIQDPAELCGIIPAKRQEAFMRILDGFPNQSEYTAQLVPDHALVQESFGKFFAKIDAAKSRDARRRAIIDALTGRSKNHIAFRTYLPAMLPLIWKKYGEAFKDAARRDNSAHDQWRRSAAMAHILEASSKKNIKFLTPYFKRSWLEGKIGDKGGMFRDEEYNRHYHEQFRRSLEYPDFMEIMNKSYEYGMYARGTKLILPLDPETGDIMILGDSAYF